GRPTRSIRYRPEPRSRASPSRLLMARPRIPSTTAITKTPPPISKRAWAHTLCLRAEDVLTFLGRKLHGKFAGEILNDWKRRWPGARVKHAMKANWIRMYDKHGCVLRVETVINDLYEFKVRRRAGRRSRRTLGWHPLPKGVAYLLRYAAVSATANHRYLDALAVVDDPAPAQRALDRLVQPVRDGQGRPSRPFNPAALAVSARTPAAGLPDPRAAPSPLRPVRPPRSLAQRPGLPLPQTAAPPRAPR